MASVTAIEWMDVWAVWTSTDGFVGGSCFFDALPSVAARDCLNGVVSGLHRFQQVLGVVVEE